MEFLYLICRLQIPHNVSVKPNEKTTLKCEIYGYPASTITWSYIPCEKLDLQLCDRNKTITFSVIRSIFLIIRKTLAVFHKTKFPNIHIEMLRE